MALPVDEFLGASAPFLPGGFVRIRHFGFLANRAPRDFPPLCFALPAQPAPTPTATAVTSCSVSVVPWKCPFCGGAMVLIERLTATQITSAATLVRTSA